MKSLNTKSLMAAAVGVACIFSFGCRGKKSADVKSMHLVLSTAPTSSNIYTGVMTSEKRGLAGGEKGQIFYTEDGGKTWNDSGNVSPCIHGIYPVNDDEIVFAVDTYSFGYSTDGGKSIRFHPRAPKPIPKSCNMISKDYGWIWDKYYLYEFSTETGKYVDLNVPKQSDGIEAGLVMAKGKGMFCDFKGDVYYTENNGAAWEKRGNVFVGKGKPVVKSLFSTVCFDMKDGIVRAASVVSESGTRYLVVAASLDEGKSFVLESKTKINKEPNSIIFNRHYGISVFNIDRTVDLYEM